MLVDFAGLFLVLLGIVLVVCWLLFVAFGWWFVVSLCVGLVRFFGGFVSGKLW